MAINKTQLVQMVAENAGLTKVQAGAALDAFISAVTTELASGGKVSVAGLGNWSVRQSAARKGRNPQTGAEILIEARKAPKFSAASALKTAVN